MLITTLVVSFSKNGGGSVSVNLWFLVVCVRCKVLCLLVVSGNAFLLILIVVILLCVVIIVFCCVWCVSLVDW